MEDERILALYFARSEEAVARTAEKYGGRLRAIALRILENAADAEECENDAYLTAWNSIPPQRPVYFFAWLAKVTRHLALDRCRRDGACKRSALIVQLSAEMEECIPAPGGPGDSAGESAAGAAISRFLSLLEGDTRYIFVRRYWFLDSIAEIAADLGASQSKIKSALFRTRGRLKKYLEREGYGE